jgi:hypothetical protein
MRRAVLPAFLLFSIIAPFAAARQPAPQILGLRLGMSYDQAHSRLNEIGQFKSEDEGQQVWTLTRDRRYQYVIIGFDRDRQVRYVTALARPDGKPVSYSDVGNVVNATRSGGPGNLSYTWRAHDKNGGFEYLVIAKGKGQRYLDRYAVKRLGVESETEERD